MALLERQAATKVTIPSPVPKVSVVMPAYNQERYCGEAIESILAQTFVAFECIIVDDGSGDGTSALLEWYARTDARIHLIRHEVNRGISASLNGAIGRARCELIARMDADDIALPHRLERQVAFMDQNPGIVAAGSSYRTIGDGGDIIGGIYAMESDPKHIRLGMAGGPMLAHPTVIMRRSLVLKAGGYRSAFDLAEDLDLWLRLMEIGELSNILTSCASESTGPAKGIRSPRSRLLPPGFPSRRLSRRASHYWLCKKALRMTGASQSQRNLAFY